MPPAQNAKSVAVKTYCCAVISDGYLFDDRDTECGRCGSPFGRYPIDQACGNLCRHTIANEREKTFIFEIDKQFSSMFAPCVSSPPQDHF